MNTHNCGNCGTPMSSTWDRPTGRRVFQCARCGYGHTAQTPQGDVRRIVDHTISPETVAGPTGQPTWSVTASLSRPGGTITEERHVRAAEELGAVAVAKEVMLDVIHMDVYIIDEGSNT